MLSQEIFCDELIEIVTSLITDMKFHWTSEKLAKLSLLELKQLLENAKERNQEDAVSLCEAELALRKPKSKGVKLPDDFVRVSRSAEGKLKEAEVSSRLIEVALSLSNRFDFSSETARSLSEGSTGFIPHQLLDSKGKAKTGGAQKAGRVLFDRYISYRLRDDVFALLGILLSEDDEAGVRYQVLGPASMLTNYRVVSELRPYLMDGERIGVSSGGEEFQTFDEAAARFVWMIEQVTPKL